ncbi:hypothetical protein CR152_26665 [Massilia violaceinigra]|uniref:Uncharacterized protein n=2 Tax=Massilia violaceinigra TaxID=2045208 RepID=A0A2D2DRT2_9BURK|nr:hypothetical protein CR152_26665 [Massilia violaceinigra]
MLFKNDMARELEPTNPILQDIHDDFLNLARDSTATKLKGLEVFENKFVTEKCNLFGRACDAIETLIPSVVTAQDAGGYFGAPEVIADTNHFTVVKPENSDARVHTRLRRFYQEIIAGGTHPPVPADSPSRIRLSGSIPAFAWTNVPGDSFTLSIIASPADCTSSTSDADRVNCTRSLDKLIAHPIAQVGDRRWVPAGPARQKNLAGPADKYTIKEVYKISPSGTGYSEVSLDVFDKNKGQRGALMYESDFVLQEYSALPAQLWTLEKPLCPVINCIVEMEVPMNLDLKRIEEYSPIGTFSNNWDVNSNGFVTVRLQAERTDGEKRFVRLMAVRPKL